MFITTKDDTRLFVKDMGQGQPVILIHGWPLNADMWEYQTLTLLENGFRVIAYDRRGFGRSSAKALSYNYDTFASDLNDVIEHLKLDQVCLVGFSMGGGEIARYLSRYGSKKIANSTLIGSITPYLLKGDTNPDGVDEKEFEKMIEGLRDDHAAFFAQFAKTFYGVGWVTSPVSEDILHWTNMMALQASLKASIDCVNAFGKTDFRPDMKAFDIPTLIIHGESDKTVPIKPSAEAAAKMIKSAKLKTYDGAPHGLFITHKKQLNDDLLMFLEGERTRSPYRQMNDTTITIN